jgi:hypothetical protein
MQIPQMVQRALFVPIWLIAASAGCPRGGGGGPDDGTAGMSGTSVGPTAGPETGPVTSLDSTGSPSDPCSDDYDGNHDIASAFALGLEATEVIDIAQAVFGDQTVLGFGNEQGEDRLVVCPGAPDFFSIEPVCSGYLGIDLRRFNGGELDELDLYLYADGAEVARALGTWSDFYLKPLHRPVSAQGYTIEVRHASGGAQPYSLDVYLLAMAPCS